MNCNLPALLELIEPSAGRYLFLDSGRERRASTSGERRREDGSNLARLETASELKKTVDLSSRRQYQLKAKISGHAVHNYRKAKCIAYVVYCLSVSFFLSFSPIKLI